MKTCGRGLHRCDPGGDLSGRGMEVIRWEQVGGGGERHHQHQGHVEQQGAWCWVYITPIVAFAATPIAAAIETATATATATARATAAAAVLVTAAAAVQRVMVVVA